jgi:hypothetical protein
MRTARVPQFDFARFGSMLLIKAAMRRPRSRSGLLRVRSSLVGARFSVTLQLVTQLRAIKRTQGTG